jgi:hypothetical protein
MVIMIYRIKVLLMALANSLKSTFELNINNFKHEPKANGLRMYPQNEITISEFECIIKTPLKCQKRKRQVKTISYSNK